MQPMKFRDDIVRRACVRVCMCMGVCVRVNMRVYVCLCIGVSAGVFVCVSVHSYRKLASNLHVFECMYVMHIVTMVIMHPNACMFNNF